MDEIQVIALCLEIIGFSLAFFHVYKRHFAEIAHRKLTSIMKHMGADGIDFAMPGADDDESLPAEGRNYIASNNALIIFLSLGFAIYFFIVIDYGDGILWGLAELFTAMMIAGLATMIFHIVAIMLLGNLLVSLVSRSGKGDIVAGIGFVLAAIGMALETYQVWGSPLWWTVFIIWGFVLAVVYIYLSRKSNN